MRQKMNTGNDTKNRHATRGTLQVCPDQIKNDKTLLPREHGLRHCLPINRHCEDSVFISLSRKHTQSRACGRKSLKKVKKNEVKVGYLLKAS